MSRGVKKGGAILLIYPGDSTPCIPVGKMTGDAGRFVLDAEDIDVIEFVARTEGDIIEGVLTDQSLVNKADVLRVKGGAECCGNTCCCEQTRPCHNRLINGPRGLRLFSKGRNSPKRVTVGSIHVDDVTGEVFLLLACNTLLNDAKRKINGDIVVDIEEPENGG